MHWFNIILVLLTTGTFLNRLAQALLNHTFPISDNLILPSLVEAAIGQLEKEAEVEGG